MTAVGISEMYRWAAEMRKVFPWVPDVYVTDDWPEPNQAAFGGFLADGRAWVRLGANMIPGRAVGWHEMGHVIQGLVRARLGGHQDIELYRAAFEARGADPKTIEFDTHLAMEQMASMLPEAFGFGWGGYAHPCPDVPVPPTLRDWWLGLERWTPVPDYAKAIWVGSPNYSSGRPWGPPQYNVEHWTVSSAASAIATFQSPSSGVSAHYLVARDGTVYQFVREFNRAWHNEYDPDGWLGPQPGWNEISLGIEHEHLPGQDWPAAQLMASNALHRDINARLGIPIDRVHCLGHNDTGYATQCPGDLPIDRLLEDVLVTEISETRLREIIREEATTPVRDAIKAGFGIVLTQKLRRTARFLKGIPRDPAGVGGTDQTGYSDDNTPLA